MSARPRPPDHAQREAAVRERARNVLIDAGAGTGKTTILVERLVEMVAPTGDAPPLPLRRLAAISFTRKAAGELRLRIREGLLRALAEPGLAGAREAALRQALADLDTAHVGTIHGFADRLLRLRPVEAGLSPAYEIVEDEESLLSETWDVLLHAVQSGTLEAELAGTPAAALAGEATLAITLALAVELRAESQETAHRSKAGLDALVKAFVGSRDVPPPDAAPAPFDLEAFRGALREFLAVARPLRGASAGARWITRTADRLHDRRAERDPAMLLREIRRALATLPHKMRKGLEFEGDSVAWQAWKAIDEGRDGAPGLLDALRAPLDRWLATRLARLFPVVVALHERVKARRQALDQLDLLVVLRDLLARNLEVRRELQGLFDHVFVDEFQDTDPLQAEIVLYLCEDGACASRWQDVRLRPGALTLVGDPKQSIYRFRRADVATYDAVRALVDRGGPLTVTLSANFRSVPALIGWLNERFERILGPAPDGRSFDPATGTVYHQPLAAGRAGAGGPPVHVLPADFADDAKHGAPEYRRLEAEALARYLRWLVQASGVQIADPLTGQRRPVRHGDVAVLAISTWHLMPLFARLDAEDIPYASRGGTLFLADPLARRFLLGLRALADRDDGIAEAALLRPPFFALDAADLLRDRAAAAGRVPEDAAARRARQARELVTDLRRRRLTRPPGDTARDLLERTALGRAVALGRNAVQRLARLRELCLLLEQRAAEDGLDYDAATAHLRRWAVDPIQMDPPYPVGTEAVQVLTVHQAKGLEFPVVVLWDGQARWSTHGAQAAWRMERDGRGWTLALDGLEWEEPENLGLAATERAYLDAERRRVVYVAATRARDLLVVPRTGRPAPGKMIAPDLLAGDAGAMRVLDTYRRGAGAPWSQSLDTRTRPEPGDAAGVWADVAARWEPAAREAARPRCRPVAVSEAARAGEPGGEGVEPRVAEGSTDPAREARAGRHGHRFGTTVHLAIGLALADPGQPVAEAVRRAAAQAGPALLDEAAADVARALGALETEGLARRPGPDLQLEYPLAAPGEAGTLLVGQADLVAITADRVDVVDFKTDVPPAGRVEAAYPEYARQVRLYGRLLEQAGLATGRRLRCGLLFTADGTLRWVTEG